jgi:hypothetical protein
MKLHEAQLPQELNLASALYTILYLPEKKKGDVD